MKDQKTTLLGFDCLDIEPYAYAENEDLVHVTIADTILEIRAGAFARCHNLSSITLTDGLTTLGMTVFSGCEKLTSLRIPASVEAISWYNLGECPNLKEVIVDPAHKGYVSKDGIVFTKDMKELVFFPPALAGEYSIPHSVTTVSFHAFFGCDKLTAIHIPDTVTTIKFNAFDGCTGLTKLDIPKSVTQIGYNAFLNVRQIRYQGSACDHRKDLWGAEAMTKE